MSQSVLDQKRVYFDTKSPRLYKDGVTKFVFHKNGEHYTFTATGVPHAYPQKSTKVFATTAITLLPKLFKKRSAKDWHIIMAYVSGKAIKHLERSLADVKLFDSATSVLKTNQCKTCALTKSHQIISKSSKKI